MSGEASEVAPVTVLPAARRLQVMAYGGLILLLLQFAAPYEGLIGLPITFFLKNKLHLSANAVAQFNVLTAGPLFLGFLFGMLRDRWSPFGTGDRGLLVMFGLITGAIYAAVAFVAPSYAVLLGAVILLSCAIQVAWAAGRGMLADIGQQHAMAGQTSTVMNMAAVVPLLVAYLLGGVLSGMLEGNSATAAARMLFLVGGGLMAAVAICAWLGPKSLFQAAPRTASSTSLAADVLRIARHRPVYPALAIYLLWQFAPAGGVALQFHMANTLHATDAQVGAFYGVFYFGFIPTVAAYGWLCQRMRLEKLLWWGTFGAVLQWLPLLFARTPGQALMAAIPIGLMGGIAQAAYVDLAIRSCPRGLQGTMAMLLIAAYWVSLRFGDLWGAWLYDHKGGFTTAVYATIAVYAAILPLLLLIPKHLIATADGEALAV
jgi:MFS family permease